MWIVPIKINQIKIITYKLLTWKKYLDIDSFKVTIINCLIGNINDTFLNQKVYFSKQKILVRRGPLFYIFAYCFNV